MRGGGFLFRAVDRGAARADVPVGEEDAVPRLDRRDEFAGSYILTLTGFNAGPGRTRQWLRTMGDPRAAGSKPLDWIYRIPFEETRLYVRKVLSNVQIYRARLGEKDPLRIDKDLRRGSS